jgi:hypothetical protein
MDLILSRTVWPIGLMLAGVLVEASLLRVGIDDLDEGYFLQQGWRVLHGQVPYRDFETLYTPGLAYMHAAIFALQSGALSLLGTALPTLAAPLGSPDLAAASPAIASSLGSPELGAASPTLAAWLASPLLGPRLLAFLARVALVLLLFAMTRPLVRNPWWAVVPGLVLLLGLDDAPERWEPHPGWLSSLFAVVAAWCLSRPRPTSKRPEIWLLASGLAAAGAYAFKQNTGVFILGAIVLWCFWSGWRWYLPLLAFGLATSAWLIPLVFTLHGDLQPLGVIVGAVSQAGLLSAPEPTLLIPLVAMLGGVWLLRRDSHPHLRLYLLAGLALLLTEFPRMDTLHLIWATPLLLVVGAVALERVPRAVAVASLAATSLLLWPTLASRLSYVSLPRSPIDGIWAPTQTASDVQPTLEDIRQRTRPGEPIFVYPSSPLLYVLADRPNATRFDHLNPGSASPRQIQQVIADLERADVHVVVISDFWQTAWGAPGDNAVLEDWINAHFSEVARHGAYRVLVADL